MSECGPSVCEGSSETVTCWAVSETARLSCLGRQTLSPLPHSLPLRLPRERQEVPLPVCLRHLCLPRPGPRCCCLHLRRATGVESVRSLIAALSPPALCANSPISSSSSSINSSEVTDVASSRSSSTVFTFLSPRWRKTLCSSTCTRESVENWTAQSRWRRHR